MTLTRRATVAALGGTATLPWPAPAQKRGTIYRVGIVGLSATADIEGPRPRRNEAAAFVRAMGQLGYVYGEHYVTLAHGVAGNALDMDGLVKELVRQKPDVVVATGAACAPLQRATSTIPVVMTAALDPVGAGLVKSLVRPGSNLTGMSLQGSEATAKRLELLKELLPERATVGVIWNRASAHGLQAAQEAASARGWRIEPVEISGNDWERAFHAATRARVGGLLVLAAQVLFPRAKPVAELVAQLRLPAIYDLRPYVEAGGLMSYGPDIVDIWRRAAGFVDKILDGAKPGDIPVEQPTRFELVIHRGAARALGVTIPQRLLLRADEVLE